MESYSTPPGTQRKRAATEVGMGVVSSRSRVQASLATLLDDRRGCRIMSEGPKSPITWLGGKGRLASRIIKEFPEHHTYCEAFGGSASGLLRKPPSKVEILNDKDGRLWNLMKVIQDPELYPRLRSVCESTLFSRAEFNLSMHAADDPVESARRFMVRQRQSRGGLGNSGPFASKTPG